MHAYGNDKKIRTLGRVNDFPACYGVLWWLPGDALDSFDLAE
jgi:hypothetical protein